MAWGIVPTGNTDDINKESVDSLYERWLEQLNSLEKLGVPKQTILAQSFITPSCGTGALSLAHATKVLELTRDLSGKIRNEHCL